MTPEDALRAWLDAQPARPTPTEDGSREVDPDPDVDMWASDSDADWAAGVAENRVLAQGERFAR
jgi:hypothetical protein